MAPERIISWLHYTGSGIDWSHIVPFLVSSTASDKVSVARMLEAAIIAAVAGGISVYASVAVLGTKLDYQQAAINKLADAVVEQQRDLNAHIRWEMERLSKGGKP